MFSWFRGARAESRVDRDLAVEAISADALSADDRLTIELRPVAEDGSEADRQPADRAESTPRLARPQRRREETRPGRIALDHQSILDPHLNAPSAEEHARKVVESFYYSKFAPGEIVETHDMRSIYSYVCRELGWRERKWGGPRGVGYHLRVMFNPPGREKYKPYRQFVDRDGVSHQLRVFIVPDRSVLARALERGRQRPDRQSTREALAA